jgi:hypothetical protein
MRAREGGHRRTCRDQTGFATELTEQAGGDDKRITECNRCAVDDVVHRLEFLAAVLRGGPRKTGQWLSYRKGRVRGVRNQPERWENIIPN